MRSLRLKLIVTFLVISIVGTLLTTIIVSFSNQRAFDEFLQEQEQARIVDEMLAYYESNGSWQDVNQLFQSKNPQDPQDQFSLDPRLPIALIDQNSTVIISNRQYKLGTIVPEAVLIKGTPLEIDGVHIGTVLLDDQPPPRNPVEEAFAVQINSALLMGALGGTAVAVVLAIFMARTLTKPLRELTRASRQMAQGNLHQEVPVRTKDELGELAVAFNHMSADLDHANQARRQMTADIAHDLRTPLTVLSGYLEAMEDGTLAPTPARLNMMQEEVDVLMRLVSDLRTLSLTDTGQLTLQKEPVIIGELLAQLQAAFVHQAAQSGVALSAETEKLQVVLLDSSRMRQALGNLVSNALRHTPTGGTVDLTAAQTADGGVRVTIADTGSGIPESDLPYIFNRFYRGDRSRQEGSGESGLGLAIAKSLIVAHDGTIEVSSTEGKGTTFTISLPG